MFRLVNEGPDTLRVLFVREDDITNAPIIVIVPPGRTEGFDAATLARIEISCVPKEIP